MTKEPLNPTGVSEVVSKLYALPHEFLVIEAEEIATDFPLWLTKHFELTPHQQAFIASGLHASFIEFVQSRIPFFFLHRLPISYAVMGKEPEDDDEEWGKIIEGIDGASRTSSPHRSGGDASGTFQFIARYYRK
ncbi:hypothetical protein [Parapedobacter tibetensis]|uniref:hypothetical protein n=1 Tax=Parapedobacter tibetensis TaxID=2972951 RepID=UPI00214D3AA2|nr:hypothetical protein [Parapedobacter tibetensis]